jgi:hypothetical protein
MSDITWRRDRYGVAHACAKNWVTALCGTQCGDKVTKGSPCPRCMQLAPERLTAN